MIPWGKPDGSCQGTKHAPITLDEGAKLFPPLQRGGLSSAVWALEVPTAAKSILGTKAGSASVLPPEGAEDSSSLS